MSNVSVTYFVHQDVDSAVRAFLAGDAEFASRAESMSGDAATLFAHPRWSAADAYDVIFASSKFIASAPEWPVPRVVLRQLLKILTTGLR